jgi:hypothetical protein
MDIVTRHTQVNIPNVEMGGVGKRLMGEKESLIEEEVDKSQNIDRHNGCLPKLEKYPMYKVTSVNIG